MPTETPRSMLLNQERLETNIVENSKAPHSCEAPGHGSNIKKLLFALHFFIFSFYVFLLIRYFMSGYLT